MATPSNRVVINVDSKGFWSVCADQPVELYQINDHHPDDRVYRMDVVVGVQHVRAQLRDDPVGCIDDAEFGPLQPSNPHLAVVDGSENASTPEPPLLSPWQGWDQGRDGWAETKHKDRVCAAVFGPAWSMEDAATLIGFIESTWGTKADRETQ